MLSFNDWLNEGSRGQQNQLRSRVSLFKPAIQAGVHPELQAPVDYTSASDARDDLHKAAIRAQQLNREYRGKVPIYHSIIIDRKKRPLEDTFKLLFSKNAANEQSVSVKKGIWDAGLVLQGYTKRLLYYWDTDIHTKSIPGNKGLKIPLDAKRPSDFRPYDEALVCLSDVNWTHLYVDEENEKVVNAAGGLENLETLAKNYGLEFKHVAHSEGLLKQRYEYQVTIDQYLKPTVELYRRLLNRIEKILSAEDFSRNKQGKALLIKRNLTNIDPTFSQLVKFPEKRAEALKSLYEKLEKWGAVLRSPLDANLR
jgi:hypothetical protein